MNLRNSHFLCKKWGFWDGGTSEKQSKTCQTRFGTIFEPKTQHPPSRKIRFFCVRIKIWEFYDFGLQHFIYIQYIFKGFQKIEVWTVEKTRTKIQMESQIWPLFNHRSLWLNRNLMILDYFDLNLKCQRLRPTVFERLVLRAPWIFFDNFLFSEKLWCQFVHFWGFPALWTLARYPKTGTKSVEFGKKRSAPPQI